MTNKRQVLLSIAVLLFSPLVLLYEAMEIGMTTALTRLAAQLGFNMRRGIKAYFDIVKKGDGEMNIFIRGVDNV